MTTHLQGLFERYFVLAGRKLIDAGTDLDELFGDTTGGDYHGDTVGEYHGEHDYHDDALGAHGDGEHHSEFGVHITYDDLYNSILFLACIYVGGKIASQLLRMPDLVGEIVVGIILGPPLVSFVPNPQAWVLLGEIGLVILVLEAGIDIDISTLKLIGTRGFLIASVGSVLPIALGGLIAWAIGITDVLSIIAAGATFGPTSLGIALNILRSGGILNTPVGQLIISAAVIDDMIALIILSQLEAFAGTITVLGVLIPVISALLFLFVGGAIAIFVIPPFVNNYVLPRIDKEHHDRVELAIMFAIMLAMMPATYYGGASYLMGAFVAGLAFCTSHGLHAIFVRQFKRLLQWLMRIFFAASIGFQVPITDFASGQIIWQGLAFSLALLGKLAVGFMVPNFTQSRSFTNFHLRDCLITGFSMAAEGEFAFVIAVFSVDAGLIDRNTYASVVLAVLLSTIVPPFLLRFTISYYGKKAEQAIDEAAKTEMERKHNLESTVEDTHLVDDVMNQTAVFFCIQTQSEAKWNILFNLMATMSKQGLEIIDHRSWSPRGINTTLINEIYCKDTVRFEKGKSDETLRDRIFEIKEGLENTINQRDIAKVKVQRWYPGVVEEIIESVDESKNVSKKEKLALSDTAVSSRLLGEAKNNLERKDILMNAATKAKSVADILGEISKENKAKNLGEVEEGVVDENAGTGVAASAGDLNGAGRGGEGPVPRKRARRRFQKTRSTPVVGGGLFGETSNSTSMLYGDDASDVGDGLVSSSRTQEERIQSARNLFSSKKSGRAAEIIVQGEAYKIRISEETLKKLRTGYSGEMLDSRGISVSTGLSIEPDDVPIVHRLQGYVRNVGTHGMISEGTVDDESELSNNEQKYVGNIGTLGMVSEDTVDDESEIEKLV